jgi:hypothetical protein
MYALGFVGDVAAKVLGRDIVLDSGGPPAADHVAGWVTARPNGNLAGGLNRSTIRFAELSTSIVLRALSDDRGHITTGLMAAG